MTNQDENLPDDVHLFQLGERTIYVIGTAHVSAKSTELVDTMLRELRPDTVAVELCQPRFHALKHPDEWRKTDIVRVIREGKIFLLMAQLFLSGFQKKIGGKLGVAPGAEMLRAVEVADELGSEIVLADRAVSITLHRTWSNLGFWGGFKLLWSMLLEVFDDAPELGEDEIERLKSADVLEEAMKEFARALPKVQESLIDERDQYLAGKIKDAPGDKIVAVVGAGHVAGIGKYLKEEVDLLALERLPSPSVWSKIAAWILPLLFLFLIIYGFVVGGSALGGKMVWDFVLVTAVAGGIGALFAWSHPLTILSAIVASPFGAAHPLVASGWIAGLVEATLRKPDVSDFEQLQNESLGLGLCWKNRVTRVILVIVSVNLAVGLGMAVSTYLLVNHLNA